ncbi:transposase (fragment) [Planktothrix tepida PCC 9214]|uniref:Transposase n=1 Tax=Planktothrix tepida PCC 9214 TaxID=671072 RepID=A0A1J1LCP7_9CYAN
MYLLQCHKTVSIEALATLMPYPIKFESRRRNIQRFLNLESLKIETLWFPLIEIILKEKFKPEHPLKLAIDRTQWRDRNLSRAC